MSFDTQKTPKPNKPKKTKARSLLSVFKFIFGFAVTLLLIGFAGFVLYVNKAAPPKTLGKADGIVVLTGKGGGRLLAGGMLLKEGHGERLLISGVNTGISAQKIQTLIGVDDTLFSCCVDLDYIAENTYGNGQETANWARALGYEEIIVVTSNYHMLRAKVEISGAMGGIQIIGYPVKTQDDKSKMDKFRRLTREYGKLLLSYAREPGARPSQETTEKTET